MCLCGRSLCVCVGGACVQSKHPALSLHLCECSADMWKDTPAQGSWNHTCPNLKVVESSTPGGGVQVSQGLVHKYSSLLRVELLLREGLLRWLKHLFRMSLGQMRCSGHVPLGGDPRKDPGHDAGTMSCLS
ncbi:hypothetical protein WMY93_026325 [Mugilogobius chulae]|uniref:Uncharacterized protein n=1 Tax=Mugilogobius chulae TaxID=88201 RepID=A0AAW0MYQ4_9GOBI